MARVNIGVHPKYLSDQHLIAESVEITMITGSLRKNKYEIKSAIPKNFVMGKGHMNFFKNKILYLKKRLDIVNEEMRDRGFNPGTHIDLEEYPKHLINDWEPTLEESLVLRYRIGDRLLVRSNGKTANRLHRYRGRYIGWYNRELRELIIKSELNKY